MFNIGAGEMALIAVAALLLLGPKRLPELARGLGKFMREFRRQTDDVRAVVEREFYKMDQEMSIKESLSAAPSPQPSSAPAEPPLTIAASPDAVAVGSHAEPEPEPLMNPVTEAVRSQLTAGMPPGLNERPTVAPIAEPVPLATSADVAKKPL